MFDALTDRVNDVFRNLRGRGRISEANVTEVMREIRTALLEADVNLEVARSFCDEVQEKALGAEVIKTLKPADVMVRIAHRRIIRVIDALNLNVEHVRCRA